MNKATVVNTLISSVGGAIVGGAITFLVVRKTYKERADQEIAEVKKYYALVRKEANVVGIYGEMPAEEPKPSLYTEEELAVINNTASAPDPDEAPRLDPEEMEAVRKYVKDLGYSGADLSKVAARKADELSHESILRYATDDPGQELDGPNGKPIEPENVVDDSNEEMPSDSGLYTYIQGQPHLISVFDFLNGDEEWEQVTLTYYRGDDTILDEAETIVNDRDRYIDARHLKMFGIKSDDPDVVYVRSPQISTDFEIMLNKGKASAVLGPQQNDDEEIFERKKAPQRMRDSD